MPVKYNEIRVISIVRMQADSREIN